MRVAKQSLTSLQQTLRQTLRLTSIPHVGAAAMPMSIKSRFHLQSSLILRYSSSSSIPPIDIVSETATTPPVSSCKEGTILKGLNVLKDGHDPVAMADSAYPPWLWTLLDTKQTDWLPEDQLSIRYLRTITRGKIKANALAKKTKSF
ncbi:hypothetical protein BSLG_002820 [Batrachochytrium salamandrivorans]|nr:hypothetical protein BASA60_006370 [Batrachochytrium salamandrivorans]KAJ1339827.1 hypothetical protein BSLG_005565 [Batrachochytrium salamandrivorans]KAJ1342723.1 hypothetical protein BSLG_002820 [Batrachochytrium salamandrivorans]